MTGAGPRRAPSTRPMGSDFALAPGNSNTITGPDGVFTYALYWPDPAPWSDSAIFRLVSEDGSDTHDFQKSDGTPLDDLVVFAFHDAQPGTPYRGLLVEGDVTLSLFGSADLCALQHPADPYCYLPFPDPNDQQTAAQQDTASAPSSQGSTDDSPATGPASGDTPSAAGDSTPPDGSAGGDSSPADDPVPPAVVAAAADSAPSPPPADPFA
jgi:hypothetical protein